MLQFHKLEVKITTVHSF